MDKGWESLGGVTQIEIEPYNKIIDREDGTQSVVPIGKGRKYAQAVWL
jgi:hypothetical protein